LGVVEGESDAAAGGIYEGAFWCESIEEGEELNRFVALLGCAEIGVVWAEKVSSEGEQGQDACSVWLVIYNNYAIYTHTTRVFLKGGSSRV